MKPKPNAKLQLCRCLILSVHWQSLEFQQPGKGTMLRSRQTPYLCPQLFARVIIIVDSQRYFPRHTSCNSIRILSVSAWCVCLASSTAVLRFEPVPLVAIFLLHQVNTLTMLQWSLSLSLFICFGAILSVSGTPAPPPLQYTPITSANGFAHSWHAWEPDENFHKSSLRAYVQAAHEEMNRQASMPLTTALNCMILKKDRPSSVASLWVKNKGTYSASDLGNAPCRMVAPLHPKTQALYEKCFSRPNRFGGYCACIQAINGFYEKFPNDDIPKGSEMAIYGHRGRKLGPDRLIKPCRADNFAFSCVMILSAAGIESTYYTRAPSGSETRNRSRSRTGSESPRPRLKAQRTTTPDLHLPLQPYVSSDEPLSASSSGHM